jgi:hypothetical protein
LATAPGKEASIIPGIVGVPEATLGDCILEIEVVEFSQLLFSPKKRKNNQSCKIYKFCERDRSVRIFVSPLRVLPGTWITLVDNSA